MGVYNSLTTSDVIVTPFKVNKSFAFQGASEITAPNVGIDRFLGKNTPFSSGSGLTGQIDPQYESLIYNSIKQLYYTNYIEGVDGSPVLTSSIATDGVRIGQHGTQPSYYNYLPNTLDANRAFPTSSNDEIGLISIPSNLFGEYIKPGSFSFKYGVNTITDDGEGSLFQNGGKVGDIIYQHGMIIITGIGNSLVGAVYGSGLYGSVTYGTSEATGLDAILLGTDITCSFQSTMTIYESQYKCTFSPNEFTYTQNPSAISGSTNSGVVYDFLTGSYFQPYITTVGLYNDTNQLVAVGKLSQPLQSSNVTDTTILVNLDL